MLSLVMAEAIFNISLAVTHIFIVVGVLSKVSIGVIIPLFPEKSNAKAKTYIPSLKSLGFTASRPFNNASRCLTSGACGPPVVASRVAPRHQKLPLVAAAVPSSKLPVFEFSLF